MSKTLGLSRLGHLIAEQLPEALQLRGSHWTGWRQRPARVGQSRGQLRPAQLLQCFGAQRTNPQLLGVLGIDVKILPVPFKALGRPQLLPARCLVTGAPKTLWVHKGLHQQNRMTKGLLPILSQPLTEQLQNATAQIGPLASGGQNEKAAILGNEMPALLHLARRPLQPAIPWLEVKGSRIENGQGHPLAAILGDVTKHLANGGGVPQIVLRLYDSLETIPFGLGDEPDRDTLKKL